MVLAEGVTEQIEEQQETVVTATVILCAWRNLLAETAECMLQLRDAGWGYMIKRGDALITRSRSIAVSSWYRNTTDDVFLMIDDDVVFLPEHADHVVQLAREKRSIVCGAYPVKDGSHLACRRFPGQEITFAEGAEAVEIVYPATGFMACHRDVITAMIEAKTPDGKPHFPICGGQTDTPMWPFFDTFPLTGPDGESEYLSEDYAFGEVARQLGFKVWLDPSVILFHMGFYPYTIENMKNVQNSCAFCGNTLDVLGFGHKLDCATHTPVSLQTSRGYRMDFDSQDGVITKKVQETGEWEENVAKAIEKHIRPGWTFLDLGAHVGYFSLLAATKGANVIAVEANPLYAKMLRKNMDMNGFPVELHPVAVSTREGLTRLNADPRFCGHGGAAFIEADSGIEVETTRLASIMDGRTADMIKVDLEGLEGVIFKDAPEVMGVAKVVIFEVGEAMSQRFGMSVGDVIALVQSYGYDVTYIDGTPLDAQIKALLRPEQYANLLAVKR